MSRWGAPIGVMESVKVRLKAGIYNGAFVVVGIRSGGETMNDF